MIPVDTIKIISEFTKTVLDEPSPDILLSHIALKTLSSLDCRGVILGVIAREGFLDLIGTYGYDEEATSQFKRIPLWTSSPITDAARTGEINVFKSARELVTTYPHLSQFDSDEQMVTVSAPIKYRNCVVGAIGFTSKIAPRDSFHLSDATQTVLALCGLYVKSYLNNKKETEPDFEAAAQTLSPRQKEIIRLFEKEMTTDQIADRLKFSSSTIKQDIIKIYDIFGVNSRDSVIELAKKAGLTEVRQAN